MWTPLEQVPSTSDTAGSGFGDGDDCDDGHGCGQDDDDAGGVGDHISNAIWFLLL